MGVAPWPFSPETNMPEGEDARETLQVYRAQTPARGQWDLWDQ